MILRAGISRQRDTLPTVLSGSTDVIDPANHLVATELERRRYQALTRVSCQSALNIDPLSASEIDPLIVSACAGSPYGGPARRGVPVARLTQRRAGGFLWTHRCKPG